MNNRYYQALRLFLFSFLTLFGSLAVRAQYQTKNAGVCFRFDDYQPADKLRKLNTLFNKYGYKFTYAMNSAIPDLMGDTAFWNAAHELEKAGHELADQTPSDVVHYFEPALAAVAQKYIGRAGIDHVTIGTPNRVCIKTSMVSTTGTGDEGSVRLSGNKVISVNAGEFSWTKLNDPKFTTHIYLPATSKLLVISDVYNANSKDPDTLYVQDVWKETVDLGTASGIAYRKISPYQITVDKEGLQTMMEFSLDIFSQNNLKLPKTFIHPGGSHPYLDQQLLKDALDPFGFKGGASYPQHQNGITYYNPKYNYQFWLQGGEITPEFDNVSAFVNNITEAYARNQVVVSINHCSKGWATYDFDQMLANLEQILIWCKASSMPVKTYQDWVTYLWYGNWDQTDDIFPPLKNDLNKNGVPDGYTPGAVGIRDTLNGVTYSGNHCYKTSSAGNIFMCDRVFGVNRGKMTFSVSTKGGANANDYLTLVVNMPEISQSKYLNIATNSAAYTERSVDVEIPYGVTYVSIALNYNTGTNSTVYVSGMKLRSAKKPAFKGNTYSRLAHQAFAQTDLSTLAACNGYTATQLTFSILTQPQNLTASLSSNRYLNLTPKTNRFWIGTDSVRLSVKAPDNTADTIWHYIRSQACKVCKDQQITISVNRDSVNDASYSWSSNPSDPALVSVNAAQTTAKPSQKTTYRNQITFKNNSKRTDSVVVDLIATQSNNGPFEQKRFNGAYVVSYTLAYPAYYQYSLYKVPSGGAKAVLNGNTVTLTRDSTFIGNLEVVVMVSSPSCKVVLHTLAATTYATGISPVQESTSKETLQFYPNPSGQELNLLNELEEGAMLQIYSLNGVLMQEISLKEGWNALQGEAFPAGVYLLQLQSATARLTGKWIKY